MAIIKQPGLHIKRTSILKGINGFGKVLKNIGLDPFKLDADDIIDKARKRAVFIGPMPGNTETGLHNLINSIKEEGRPNPFGALAAKTLFERTLYGRFKVEQVLAKNPEIEKADIKEPVFIIGMPRTGTTILHATMYKDTAHRSPLAWECLLPYPAPTPENYKNNAQIKRVTKDFDQLFKLVPDFQLKHYMTADSPQECLSINALDFNSFQPMAQFYLPSYMNWFANESDQLMTMRFHKRFLQYLQSGGLKPERWLLKTPVHLMRLPELFEVYPDARVIMTHRHPAKVVASTASLLSSVRSLYGDHEDPVHTGYEQAEIWSSFFNRFMESRKKLNKEDQIIDLKFDDFVADQIGIIQKIYDHFNWNLTEEAFSGFKDFLNQNPKDNKGKHVYNLEDFGLTQEFINREYAPYIDFLEQLK